MTTHTTVGQLRHRVEFIGIGRQDDGAGGFERIDNVELTAFASIRPASSGEQYRAQRLEQHVTHVIIIRWRSDFRPFHGQRVRWSDRAGVVREAYILAAHEQDERGRFMVIQAREGGPT